MLNLTLLMIERVGLIIILAFFLVNFPPFRKLLFRQDGAAKFQLIIIFAFFANCNSKLASADKAHRRKGSWEFQVDQD